MPPTFQMCAIEDLCASVTSGGTPSRKQAARYYDPTGYPWVKTKELEDRRITDTEEHINDVALSESSAKLLPAHTVLVAMYGATVGMLGILDQPAACNQACAALLVDERRAHYRYVFYALLHARPTLQARAVGSAQQNLSGRLVKQFRLPYPPLSEQRAIASVLGGLDAKIESNRRLADSLRGVLMLVPPHEGVTTSLDAIAQFRNGGALTKQATGAGRPILRIKELRGGVTGDTPRTDTDVRADHEVSSGDLLFSWSGTLLTHRWSGPDSVLNQHVFRVDPADGFPRWFLESWIERHLGEFRAIAADKATTMGHIQRRHLRQAQVPVPDKERMRELCSLYDPLDDQRMTVLYEAETLTAIRDALLPKLISGKIRVPLSDDPEEQIGVATEAVGA